MFWIRFSISFVLMGAWVGCSPEEENLQTPASQEEVISEEQKIIRQIENKLGISAAETYDIQILYKHIDPDTLKDALILVNREDHAFQRVKQSNSETFFEKTGYTAPQNYVFVKLGGTDQVISTTPIGSNVKYPLRAKFIELTSKAHQDFYVEYRIRNSLQRNYYTVRNNNLFLTFSCPVFDSIGAKQPKVYDIQHLISPVRIAKDIALYHGRFLNYDSKTIEDVNGFDPQPDEIIGTKDLFVYFIFDDQSMKYITPMRAEDK